MAAKSTIEGLFIAHQFNEWTEPIGGDDGRPAVPPGKSLTLFVYTPHDRDVCKVKVGTTGRQADAKALDEMKSVCDRLDFGVQVIVEAGDKSYGAYRGYSIRPASESAKPASASAKPAA